MASRTSFQLLAEEPGREIVLGTLVIAPPGGKKSTITPQDFRILRAPGFALTAINFRVNDAGSGTFLVSTETSVYATDASTRRKICPLLAHHIPRKRPDLAHAAAGNQAACGGAL